MSPDWIHRGPVSSLLAHGVVCLKISPFISRPFALGWCAAAGLFWPIPWLLCPSTCQDDCTIGILQLEQLISPEPLQVLRLGPLPASRRLEVWLQRNAGDQVLITEGRAALLGSPGVGLRSGAAGLAAWCSAQPLDQASRPLSADHSAWLRRDQAFGTLAGKTVGARGSCV
jgi:hypothetical protein